MIRFDKNTELDMAMKYLILSMFDVNNYPTMFYIIWIVSLLPRMKKCNILDIDLKYDCKIITESPYFRNIKFDSAYTVTVKYEKAVIKKRTFDEHELS